MFVSFSPNGLFVCFMVLPGASDLLSQDCDDEKNEDQEDCILPFYICSPAI